MTTRHLLALFDSIYLLAMAAMVGGIVFLTFIVAPILFRVLGAESGGRLVRALFPRYYLWNAVLGAIALPAFVAGPLCFPEYRGPAVGVQAAVLLAIILIMLYGGNSLAPEINRARDLGAEGKGRFDRLHRRSVVLNAAAMIGGLGLLVAIAWRPAPRTQGIIESSPAERVLGEKEKTRGRRPSGPGEAATNPVQKGGGIHPGGP